MDEQPAGLPREHLFHCKVLEGKLCIEWFRLSSVLDGFLFLDALGYPGSCIDRVQKLRLVQPRNSFRSFFFPKVYQRHAGQTHGLSRNCFKLSLGRHYSLTEHLVLSRQDLPRVALVLFRFWLIVVIRLQHLAVNPLYRSSRVIPQKNSCHRLAQEQHPLVGEWVDSVVFCLVGEGDCCLAGGVRALVTGVREQDRSRTTLHLGDEDHGEPWTGESLDEVLAFLGDEALFGNLCEVFILSISFLCSLNAVYIAMKSMKLAWVRHPGSVGNSKGDSCLVGRPKPEVEGCGWSLKSLESPEICRYYLGFHSSCSSESSSSWCCGIKDVKSKACDASGWGSCVPSGADPSWVESEDSGWGDSFLAGFFWAVSDWKDF